jgi:hypothetical protein
LTTKSCDIQSLAAKLTVDQLVADLSEPHLINLIDEPIDAALTTFEFERDKPQSFEDLHATVGLLLRHLQNEAGVPPTCTSAVEPADEAAMFVRSAYGGREPEASHAALSDALDENIGMREVLGRIAEYIKSWRRATHTRSVIARRVTTLNWRGTLAVTAELLRRCHFLLRPPPRGLDYHPDEAIDQVHRLVEGLVAAERDKQQMLSGSFASLI